MPKDRQHWINLIRAVSEYHGKTSTKPPRPPPPKEPMLKRSATIGASSPRYTRSPIERIKTITHPHPHPSSPQANVHTATSNPIKEELKNIKDALNSVNEYHSSALESLEVGNTVFTQPGK